MVMETELGKNLIVGKRVDRVRGGEQLMAVKVNVGWISSWRVCWLMDFSVGFRSPAGVRFWILAPQAPQGDAPQTAHAAGCIGSPTPILWSVLWALCCVLCI